uniref:PGC-1 and ERR-induced regulator in muscle protein 1 n=1 Tax=Oncorhynchus mykiss TaxID=8022 RepID=A0A8C7UQ29_ONCMY
MDDLDHSVHIAERDWDSFYKESEECSLPQPELAGSDDLGLSDEEPEDSVCPVFPALGNVQDDPRQQNAAPNTAIPSEPSVKEEATLREDFICTDLPVKICESGSEETQLNYPLSLTEEEGGALLDRVFDNSPHAQKESDSGYYGENRESGYFEENSLTTELVKDTPGETAEQNTKETSRNEDITKNLGSVPESSSNKCIANSDPSGACDVSDIKGFDGELPSEGGTGTLHDILTPLSLQPVPLPHQDLYPGQNISQEQLLSHTETAILCERHAIVAPREEKERWFVTVNESQAPHRVHAATAVKKKRRKKKTCRNSVPRGHHTSEGPDPPPESESEIDIDGMEESNRQETMNEFSTQSCNKSKPLPDTHTLPNNYHREVYIEFPKINVSYSELPPLFSELSSSSSFSEDVNISTESPLQRDDSTEALDPESSVEENKQENYSSAVGLKRSVDHPLSKLQHLLLALHRSESVYSNEEGELFYTTSTSYDSEEEYVSATEMEDTNIPSSEIDSTLSASLPLQTPTANSQPLIQEDCLNCPLLSQREGYENTADQAYIESVRTCPSTGHSNSNPIMSEQSSVPADSKHSPDSHMTNETPAHRAGEPLTVWEHLPQTNTSEDQPPLPHPEVTVTPTENPETSYNASDPTRPVYAISAFWDEMEKLTIKDILHLRVCRSPSPPKETLHPQESDSARVDVTVTDADMLNSSLTDIEEYYSQDSSLMDTSDTADSDYFTHNDDSPKPDRSSCEFSTFSDFDEEYMPFFGTSSIPSPELGNFERRRSESPCSGAISQEETDSSTGLATPVDCEELAVEMELKDMLEEAEKSLFLNSCQDLDFAENPVLAVIDRISRMPSPILPNTDILDERYRITFPELYEYLFTEDVLSVYESLMSTSVAECCYDYSLSKYGAGVLFPPLVQQSLHGEGEPVPIFSCSLVTRSDIQAKEAVSFSSQRGWTGNWKSLLSLRRIRFPGMGSTSSSWCWRSGAWMSPAVGQAQRALPPPITPRSQADTIKDGILFSLKQSDMCLVCIAFASWVLRSADPMAADTWKAALLANVSAISAIQYLRRYVVKRREAGDLNDSTEDKA